MMTAILDTRPAGQPGFDPRKGAASYFVRLLAISRVRIVRLASSSAS